MAVANPDTWFDGAGNLKQLAHLRRMEWTFKGTLALGVVTERATCHHVVSAAKDPWVRNAVCDGWSRPVERDGRPTTRRSTGSR